MKFKNCAVDSDSLLTSLSGYFSLFIQTVMLAMYRFSHSFHVRLYHSYLSCATHQMELSTTFTADKHLYVR